MDMCKDYALHTHNFDSRPFALQALTYTLRGVFGTHISSHNIQKLTSDSETSP